MCLNTSKELLSILCKAVQLKLQILVFNLFNKVEVEEALDNTKEQTEDRIQKGLGPAALRCLEREMACNMKPL